MPGQITSPRYQTVNIFYIIRSFTNFYMLYFKCIKFILSYFKNSSRLSPNYPFERLNYCQHLKF